MIFMRNILIHYPVLTESITHIDKIWTNNYNVSNESLIIPSTISDYYPYTVSINFSLNKKGVLTVYMLCLS